MNREHKILLLLFKGLCAANLTASFHHKFMLIDIQYVHLQSENSTVITSLTLLDCFQKNKYEMLKSNAEELVGKVQETVQCHYHNMYSNFN